MNAPQLDFEEFVAVQPSRIRETHSEKEMRSWFDMADENGNGTLSINEFFKWRPRLHYAFISLH